MRTREQLEAEGVKLIGPIVPKDFKSQSDGGSVPLGRAGRWLFKEPQWRAAAYIHDFRYYLIALQWRGPSKDREPSVDWVGERMKADYEFKLNRRLCAKRKFLGAVRALYCFRAVRTGGRASMKEPSELWVPPTLKAIEEVQACCERPLTQQAMKQIAEWIRSLT